MPKLNRSFVVISTAAASLLPAHAQQQAQSRPSPPEPTEQQRLRAQSPGGPLTPGVELPRWPAPRDPLASAVPVTDALLANPSPNDWLSWRRTQDGLGFSPLTSIDKENVGACSSRGRSRCPRGQTPRRRSSTTA